MSWLKDVLTDLIVTATIAIGVFVQNEILTGIILGYTILMLIAKSVVYFGDFHLQMMNKVQNEAPDWFSHLLYAINVALLTGFQWWYTGALWVLIWLISWLTQRSLNSENP